MKQIYPYLLLIFLSSYSSTIYGAEKKPHPIRSQALIVRQQPTLRSARFFFFDPLATFAQTYVASKPSAQEELFNNFAQLNQIEYHLIQKIIQEESQKSSQYSKMLTDKDATDYKHRLELSKKTNNLSAIIVSALNALPHNHPRKKKIFAIVKTYDEKRKRAEAIFAENTKSLQDQTNQKHQESILKLENLCCKAQEISTEYEQKHTSADLFRWNPILDYESIKDLSLQEKIEKIMSQYAQQSASIHREPIRVTKRKNRRKKLLNLASLMTTQDLPTKGLP